MNGCCDVCGCKTEEDSLRGYKLNNQQFQVCVFCRKQLDNAQNDKASARNLLLMDTKGRRSVQCNSALIEFMKSKGVNTSADEPEKNNTKQGAQIDNNNLSLEQEVELLKKQVEQLNDKFNKFRSRYIISKVAGIILPVIIVFIMMIILLASGTFQDLFDYFGTLSNYANM